MEKTGNTVKLLYPFETAANLEVFMPTLNDWYRVTGREFRSFSGKRRINEVEYNGPIYKYNTNITVKLTNIQPDIIVDHNFVSKRRPGEDFY